jgi:hypothetical protein
MMYIVPLGNVGKSNNDISKYGSINVYVHIWGVNDIYYSYPIILYQLSLLQMIIELSSNACMTQ